MVYLDPSWRAVSERVDQNADGDYDDEQADTMWGVTYIDEAVYSRREAG